MKRALLLALLLLGCRSAPPPTLEPEPPPQPAGPSRVVLLSLDGAGADELHRLYQEGQLQEGGFAAFFENGQVAERLIPVNPTLTATNHISLGTGYVAGETGIVSNTFHPAGEEDLLKTVSGFAAPIDTETLWEAARRQGKRVGVTTWPGADDTGPRRRADWGMIYVNDADRPAMLMELDRQAWEPWKGETRVESRSPVLRTGVQMGGEQGPGQHFELLAVDRKAGVPGYDGMMVIPQPQEAGRLPVVLDPGEWGTVRCPWVGPEGEPRQARCSVKLLALDPALASAQLYFAALYPLQAYPADFAASLEARGLSWPGPPDDRKLADTWNGKPGIDLETWTEQAERFAVFFGESLRAAAERTDWDLLMGYVPVIDEAGHQLLLTDPRQPGYTSERRDEFARARLRVWQAVDRQLAQLLDTLDLTDTALIVVSDHGMSPVHTALNPNVLLRERGLLATDADGKIVPEGTAAWAVSSGAVSHVYVAPGREDVLPTLRDLFAGWSLPGGEKPMERVFTRNEAAEVGLEHPNTGDLVLFPVPGYTFGGGGLKEGKAALPTTVLGMHGGLNTHESMHGIYLAIGAGIEPGNAGTVRTIDVAGRVAERMGIEKPRPRPVSP